MKIFFKTMERFFYGDLRNFVLPVAKGQVHIGIDGSTSSFGFSWIDALTDEKNIMFFIREEEENHNEFFNQVFPTIHSILYHAEVITATYEKTPSDFEKDTHSIRVMKNTEKAVGNFLSSGTYINLKHRFNIFDIFPNSWKAFLVNSDPTLNYRKTDKRINSVDILTTLDMDPVFWLKEADELTNHSYDGFEALAICAYGSKFISQGVFTAVYRNFKKRRPLKMIYKETSWDTFSKDAIALKSTLGSPPMSLMIPNQYHSFMENLYGLDSDDRLNIMVVSPSDFSELHTYYKFITGVNNLLMLTVVRYETDALSYNSMYI